MAEADGTYQVQRGDTFSSLSRRFGVSVAEIQAANPKVVMLKAGEKIIIPLNNVYLDTEPEATVADEPMANPVQTVPFEAKKSDDIVIALVLPFMLSQEEKEKPSQLFTEYYKGFLLAVDSMRACGKPIKVLAYDTKGTMQGVKEVMTEPLLATAQVIIGPDDEAQIKVLAEYAKENGISVFNTFAARDKSYRTMDNVMNTIVPHTTMYAKAIQYFMKEFPDMEPVILCRKDGLSEKSEFIDSFKRQLDAAGRKYTYIEFERQLSEDNLADLSASGNYAFLPMSSKLSELKAILPQISVFAANSKGKTSMWGYPEWLSFRGDPMSGMHKLNTYIFSRFYNTGKSDSSVRDVEDRFTKWYGGSMINVIPSQGLYGFDTAMYLLRALRVNDGDFNLYTPAYDGVQNCFNFAREDGAAGWVNNEMFIINYSRDGSINKYPL
ncbi:MAG: ABC transporter substrate-binding protein [Paramuribaculum sp.]|nr:ABC transporter substrate-binding protein [Paramuribaculum sp.]